MKRNYELALPALVGMLAVYFLIWPIWRAQFPLDIGPTDAWNAYFQDMAFGPGLYPAPDALVLNNYPPLSFYFIAALAKASGCDPLYVGRLVSILATLGIGVLVSIVVSQLGGKRIGSVLAGFWVIAILARSFHSYVGRDDPQLLTEFLMLLGLIWFLRNAERGTSALGPLLWMALAGFFKHNVVAIPLTAVVWLAMRDGLKAAKPLVIVALFIVAGILLCQLAYPDFLASLFASRAYSLKRVLLTGVGRLQWVAPAFVIFWIWAWPHRLEFPARFMLIYSGIALLTYLIQSTGSGVVDNSQFDLVIATAIGLGLAYSFAEEAPLAAHIGVTGVRAIVVFVLALRLVATGRIESALIMFDPDYRARFSAHAAIARVEAARVAQISGPVYCDNDVVCRMAGKRFEADDYKIGQMMEMGLLNEAQLAVLLRQRGITTVTIDPAASARSLEHDLFKPSK